MDSLTNRASAPAKTMARNVMVIGAGKIGTTVASLLASAGTSRHITRIPRGPVRRNQGPAMM